MYSKPKRCKFGRAHTWTRKPGTELDKCMVCGAISYDRTSPERPEMGRAECVRIARAMADDEAVEPELRLFARSALQWLEVEGDFADVERQS